MTTGTVQVDREQLAKAFAQAGLDPALLRWRGRITINAVVRRACANCGKPQLPTPEAPEICDCEGGPYGPIEHLGVISDSGPRGFLARQWWKLTQVFKRPQTTRHA